ncbi:hypothetical protein [Chryseolinea lacunae]|uniref:Uncharacterized protein n=1 Tax=Chryseolinea lacunae TaxID=2801331 RepID=A0ABS1L1Z3_9BACT|nr:hypothetical protein [Chryseolinea lacunae]MBL0745741.1 hypothetical protein [Chryseolinea lacunae]
MNDRLASEHEDLKGNQTKFDAARASIELASAKVAHDSFSWHANAICGIKGWAVAWTWNNVKSTI